ncbi:MAG: hypothetical protein ACKOQM_04395 [Novosphingobium sp.]
MKSVENPAEVDQKPSLVVPRSFELYIDGAKWILAIVAGLLAYGFDFLKDHSNDDALRFSFAWTAMALCGCAMAAAIYLGSSHFYLASREGGATVKEAEGYKSISDWSLVAMLTTLAIGLILFAVFGVVALDQLRKASDPPPVLVGMGNGALLQKGGHIWILERDPKGKPKWAPLATPNPLESNDARAMQSK